MGVYGETIRVSSKLFARLRDDQAILAQSIQLRLETRPGTYGAHPEYGYPLAELVNAGLTADLFARIPGEVKANIEQDTDRIDSVSVAVVSESETPAGVAIALTIDVTPRAGPSFEFTLGVKGLTVEILTGRSA